jgi:cysteine desulfurase
MRQVYLDNNATTRMRKEVLEAMMPYMMDIYGNASSVHQFGRTARIAIDEARAKVATLLGAASAEEIIFTSGGTESDNYAIKGVASALKSKGNHIITSAIEHQAVLNTCKFLAEAEGFKVTYLGVDKYGVINTDELKKAITDKTILITIMYANNEIGTVEPIVEIGNIAKEKGIYFHTDAVQAVGKLPFSAKEMNVNLLSTSAHKIYGPKGIGALYVKKGTKATPQMHGGHHEMNKRAGTENVSGIVGLGKAAELAKKEIAEEGKIKDLRDYLYKGITSKIEDIKLNGHPEKRLPNTLNVSFTYLEGESIILNLDMEGIAASTGSACTSGTLEPSHVLTAMGIDPVNTQGSVRFSLGRDNTKEDMDYVIDVLPPIIKRLRAMSPLYEKGK